MRGLSARRLLCSLGVVMALAVPGGAQDASGIVQAPILMMDRDRLFAETLYGRAVEAQFQADSETLIAENLRLEQALEEEERALTDKRASLPADEFQSLATAFDQKTEAIRAAQDQKSRAITSKREQDQQRFLQAAIPVLGDLMREAGAVAIFDQNTVILSLRGVDITDAAIDRIDAVLGDGSGPAIPQQAPAADPAPADGAATQTDSP